MSITQKATLIPGDSTEYFEVNVRSNKSSKYKQKKFAMKVLSKTLEIEFSDEWLDAMSLNPKKDSFQKAIDMRIAKGDLALTIVNYRHKETQKYGKSDYFQYILSSNVLHILQSNKSLKSLYKDVFNNYLSILPEDRHFGFELGDKGYKPKNEVLELYFDKITESVFKLNWEESGIQIAEDKLQLVNEYSLRNGYGKPLNYISISSSDNESRFYALDRISSDRDTYFNDFDKFQESLSSIIPFSILKNHTNQFIRYTLLYKGIEDGTYLKNENCNVLIHNSEINGGFFVNTYKKSDIIKFYVKFKKTGDSNKSFVKMEFTKYVNDYYTNIPDYDIEQFKRTLENGIAVDYKIVTGREIEHVYSSSNVYKQTGSLGNSCMNNGKQCSNEITKKTDFYCDNENISLIAGYVEGTEILVSRALLWTTVEGIKVMDRIYSIDEATTIHAAEWSKKQGFLNIYDYRKFGGSGRGTYYNTAPGNWRNEYDRDFVVQLTTPIIDNNTLEIIKDTYKKDAYEKRVVSTTAGKLPYLDNFNVFNLEKNLVSNSISILEGLIIEKTKVIAIDGYSYNEDEVVVGFTGCYIYKDSYKDREINIIGENDFKYVFRLPCCGLSSSVDTLISDNCYIWTGRENTGINISQFTDLISFNYLIVSRLEKGLNKFTEESFVKLFELYDVIEHSIISNENIPTTIIDIDNNWIDMIEIFNVVKTNLKTLEKRFKETSKKLSLMEALSADNIIGYRKGLKQEENESLEIID